MFGGKFEELVIILIIILILFGGKKLPELSKSIGSSIAELRKGLGGGGDKEDADKKSAKK